MSGGTHNVRLHFELRPRVIFILHVFMVVCGRNIDLDLVAMAKAVVNAGILHGPAHMYKRWALFFLLVVLVPGLFSTSVR